MGPNKKNKTISTKIKNIDHNRSHRTAMRIPRRDKTMTMGFQQRLLRTPKNTMTLFKMMSMVPKTIVHKWN